MDVISILNVLFYFVKNAYQQHLATNNKESVQVRTPSL